MFCPTLFLLSLYYMVLPVSDRFLLCDITFSFLHFLVSWIFLDFARFGNVLQGDVLSVRLLAWLSTSIYMSGFVFDSPGSCILAIIYFWATLVFECCYPAFFPNFFLAGFVGFLFPSLVFGSVWILPIGIPFLVFWFIEMSFQMPPNPDHVANYNLPPPPIVLFAPVTAPAG